MKALILSAATARLTQLVVDDEITHEVRRYVRDQFEQASEDSASETFWNNVDTVINCHACSSVWAGAAVLIAEQTRVGRFLVRVLALSQAALTVRAAIDYLEDTE